MTTVSDSIIFGNVLSTPESAKIWSDEIRTQYYLDFEAKLAKVQGGMRIIPQNAAEYIMKHCNVEEYDFVRLAKETQLIGYPVLPVVHQLVEKVNKESNGRGEFAHWGATTQDVTDTATVLQLRDTLELVETSLNAIISALQPLAAKHKNTPMPARSNLQQAVPMTFGFKIARLLATFLRHRQRLQEIKPRLLVLQFSGAGGTLGSLDPSQAMQCQRRLAYESNLHVPEIAWHTERDRIAEVGSYFALLTSTCAKFALDLKLMMQTEVGEAAEPYAPHRGSSSTMPQKRNPIGSAYITACNATVRQLSASLMEAMIEDHERSTGPWEIEWIVLPQISTLTHAALKHTQTLLEGLEVRPERMAKNLEMTRGGIVSEAVMMELGKTIGRDRAHDIVYELCRKATEEDVPLIDLLQDHEEIKLSRRELEKLCDPRNYLGLSADFTQKVLDLATSGGDRMSR